jgi:hypothetical protein
MATAAMVCGIVGLVLFFLLVLPIVAVVLGAIALSKAKRAPGPGSGRGRAWAGLILGIIGLLLFVGVVVVGAILGWYDDDVAATELEVGQCVELDVDATQLSRLPLVDCDEVHQGEVYFVQDLDGDEFPGEESAGRQGQDLCAGDAFEDYVGTPFMRSALQFYVAYPSEETWADGDREIVCIAIRPDGGDLAESVRGSGS